jgi:hypothetical protein
MAVAWNGPPGPHFFEQGKGIDMANVCPYFEGSPFCERLRSISESASETYTQKYCKGDFSACARYMVTEALGLNAVPEAMLPNETDRALRVIGRD